MKNFTLAIRFDSERKTLLVGLTILLCFLTVSNISSEAQTFTSEYQKTIEDRSSKIVNTLGLTDSAIYQKVLGIIVNQYYGLNTVQEKNKTAVEAIKKNNPGKEVVEKELKKQEEKKSSELEQLHKSFIALLKEHLSDTQLDLVKDAMTYRLLPITYAAYQDMILTLTDEQKKKIYSWLVEARELAMDAESSEKKHAVFGKYKGRINNYLSAAGYDLKKEGDEWTGGFDVLTSIGDGKGRFTRVNRQSHTVRWPANAAGPDRVINYQFDVVLEPGSTRISVGVVDQGSKKTGFQRVEVAE